MATPELTPAPQPVELCLACKNRMYNIDGFYQLFWCNKCGCLRIHGTLTIRDFRPKLVEWYMLRKLAMPEHHPHHDDTKETP